jgi:hypothetical protein
MRDTRWRSGAGRRRTAVSSRIADAAKVAESISSALRACRVVTMKPPAAKPPTTPISRVIWKTARPSA